MRKVTKSYVKNGEEKGYDQTTRIDKKNEVTDIDQ